MDLFLDCEWADVLASELVSLALVSLGLRHVFYAERDPLPADPTPWVATVVYPLLDRGQAAVSDVSMTRSLREFLAGVERPRICYDFGADRDLCQHVIDGLGLPDPPKILALPRLPFQTTPPATAPHASGLFIASQPHQPVRPEYASRARS